MSKFLKTLERIKLGESAAHNDVKVGCIVIIRKKDKILLGLRKNCYGAGQWGLPGGHMESDERAIVAACREVAEETDIDIEPNDLRFVSLNDEIAHGDKERHLQITFEYCAPDNLIPKNMEPHYCYEWGWFNLNNLPEGDIITTHLPALKNYCAKVFYDTENINE